MNEKYIENEELNKEIITALQGVFDPEIPVSIYELGLIYDIKIKEDGDVDINMTLTTANCPEAQSIPERVADVVSCLPGVREVKVEIIWDPPWSQEMMSDAAKLELGLI